MKKLFISIPMNGKDSETIKSEMNEIKAKLEADIGEELEINNWFEEGYNHPLKYLGASIQAMAEADVCYFAKGFGKARGCRIEFNAAMAYGLLNVATTTVADTMDFSDALGCLKSGCKLSRLGWNGADQFVVYQKAYPDGIPCNKNTAEAWGMNEGDLFKCEPYLQIKLVNGSHAMWVPSITDILATDWVIVRG